MNLNMSLVFLVPMMLFLELAPVQARDSGWFDKSVEYVRDFGRGVDSMVKAYNDMKEANTIGADKYFHARGNYDAQAHGPGGKHAAQIISVGRELVNLLDPRGKEPEKSAYDSGGNRWQDSVEDMEANAHGWNGGDPDEYRPPGLGDYF